MSDEAFDKQRAKAFAARMQASLNHGAFCLMASVGHRTGLFDAMRDAAPMTSIELASAAGLDERYVREWLSAIVTAGVVEVDRETLRFRLPSEHAAFLTRAAGTSNLAVYTQYLPLLGSVEDDIVDRFRNGGGVPYEKYPRFQAILAE